MNVTSQTLASSVQVVNGEGPILLVAASTLGAAAIGVAVGLIAGFLLARLLGHRASTGSPGDQSTPDVSPELLAEADGELNQRLSGLAHDIRSLLGPIMGYADLIRGSSNLEQAQSHAAKILKAGHRVEKLADDLRGTVHDRSRAAERLSQSGEIDRRRATER